MGVSLASCKRLIGDYYFGEEVCCCVQKDKGNLCREGHKRDRVAELLNHPCSACACVRGRTRYFGLDSSADQSEHPEDIS
jgi:hypothetical protein